MSRVGPTTGASQTPGPVAGQLAKPTRPALSRATPSHLLGPLIDRRAEGDVILLDIAKLDELTGGELRRLLLEGSVEAEAQWEQIRAHGLTRGELMTTLGLLSTFEIQVAVISNEVIESDGKLNVAVDRLLERRSDFWVDLGDGVLGYRTKLLLASNGKEELETSLSIDDRELAADCRSHLLLVRPAPLGPADFQPEFMPEVEEVQFSPAIPLSDVGEGVTIRGVDYVVMDALKMRESIGLTALQEILEDDEVMDVDVARIGREFTPRQAARLLNYLRRYDPSLRLVSTATDPDAIESLKHLAQSVSGNMWVKRSDGLALVSAAEVSRAVPAFQHMPEELFIKIDEDLYLFNPFAMGSLRQWIDGQKLTGPLSRQEKLCRSLLDLYYEKLLVPERDPGQAHQPTKGGQVFRDLNVSAAPLVLARSQEAVDWFILPHIATIVSLISRLSKDFRCSIILNGEKLEPNNIRNSDLILRGLATEINPDVSLGLREIFKALVDLVVTKAKEGRSFKDTSVELRDIIPKSSEARSADYSPEALLATGQAGQV